MLPNIASKCPTRGQFLDPIYDKASLTIDDVGFDALKYFYDVIEVNSLPGI